MQPLLSVLALFAGISLTIQVGVNAALRKALGNPMMAAFVSFLVGLIGLALYLAVTKASVPPRTALASAPAWVWAGGLLGAFYVAATIILGPRLGAATLLALSVLGQLLASLLVDQYGWLGFPQHSITLARLLGAVLLFGGVLLIAR